LPLNIPTSSVVRLSKIYPKWDFWFENIPSGNPAFRYESGHFINQIMASKDDGIPILLLSTNTFLARVVVVGIF
jgi:hypothetical protein